MSTSCGGLIEGSIMGKKDFAGKYGQVIIENGMFFTFEVLPSKVVSSFWTPNLNKLFDDFTVEVVAIRTAPAKNHFYKIFSSEWTFRLSYLVYGQIVGHFEVK